MRDGRPCDTAIVSTWFVLSQETLPAKSAVAFNELADVVTPGRLKNTTSPGRKVSMASTVTCSADTALGLASAHTWRTLRKPHPPTYCTSLWSEYDVPS
eukprot:gene11867-15127_t